MIIIYLYYTTITIVSSSSLDSRREVAGGEVQGIIETAHFRLFFKIIMFAQSW